LKKRDFIASEASLARQETLLLVCDSHYSFDLSMLKLLILVSALVNDRLWNTLYIIELC